MRFSNTGASWSVWESYTTSKSWTLDSGDGSKGVYVEYKDGAGNVSQSFMDTIILDTNAPTGSVSINSGDTFANSPSVTLNLSADDAGSGVAKMRFSYDGSSWSSWVVYASSMSWTLTSGDGSNMVYVQYKDNAGRESASYSDDIILDTSDPTGSIIIESGATYVSGTSVNLALSSADTGSGVAEMSFSNSGDSWTSWEAYSSGKSWTLNPSDGQKWVYVKYKDVAGNVSAAFSDDIILDTAGPTGSISIDDGASATNVVSVTLVISATDPGSGVDVMSLSADGSAS